MLFASQDKWAVRAAASGAACRSPSRPASRRTSFEKCLANQKLYNDIIAVRERGSKDYKVEFDADAVRQRQECRRAARTIEELDKLIQPLLKS